MRATPLLLALLVPSARAAGVPAMSPVRWVVPSADLPAAVKPSRSNNNIALALHEGRLYLAFRTAPIHFASPWSRLVVLSSPDLGKTWTRELELARGRDLREPHLLSLKGRLFLYTLELGTNPFAYQPRGMLRLERLGEGRWSEPVLSSRPGEIVWDIKVRRGRAWKASYVGGHYSLGRSTIQLLFENSQDGLVWVKAGPGGPVVYEGGVSEASFEFDADGALWAVTRDEDGDASGWGSHLAWAPPGAPSVWAFPRKSDPRRYDSPRLFAAGGELYLLARRDPSGPFDLGWRRLPFWAQKWLYMARYWVTPKRTALFRLDRAKRALDFLYDLPSAGDTAFPAVLPLPGGSLLVANYSSDPADSGRSWVRGQLGRTGIYLTELKLP